MKRGLVIAVLSVLVISVLLIGSVSAFSLGDFFKNFWQKITGKATENNPPSASLKASPTTGEAPLTVSFTVYCSDPDNNLAICSLAFGDNSAAPYISENGAPVSKTIQNTYNSIGNYTVVLKAVDYKMLESKKELTITVSKAATPTPTPSPSPTVSPTASPSASPRASPTPTPIIQTLCSGPLKPNFLKKENCTDKSGRYPDYCSSPTQLIKYYCKNNTCTKSIKNCSENNMTCNKSTGVCVGLQETKLVCIDSDGKDNFSVAGNVTCNNGTNYTDYCEDKTNNCIDYYFNSIQGKVEFTKSNCTTIGKICKDGACVEEVKNTKKQEKYGNREVFLISDKSWQDVLQLVSLTTWTANSQDTSWCQKGYGTPENICVYPTLIYHEETKEDRTIKLKKEDFLTEEILIELNVKKILIKDSPNAKSSTYKFDIPEEDYIKLINFEGNMIINIESIGSLKDLAIKINGMSVKQAGPSGEGCSIGDGVIKCITQFEIDSSSLNLQRTGNILVFENTYVVTSLVLYPPDFNVYNLIAKTECEDSKIDLCINDVEFDRSEVQVGEEFIYTYTLKNIKELTFDLSRYVIELYYQKPGDIIKIQNYIIQRKILAPGEEIKIIFYAINTAGSKTSFDADSIIYFIQQYNTDKVTIIGDTPEELDNLLIAEPELGAGLTTDKTQRISSDSLLDYWQSYQDVVYVEDNYELALMASTYASLINAPLIIQRGGLDANKNFENKYVICVKQDATTLNRNCNEQYNLEQLQKKYVELTNTDKIILINPNDLDIKVEEQFQPEKSANPIFGIYGKTSLAAPILASAKHEVILSTKSTNYQEVDSFIENKISSLGIDAEYLTILASPKAIDMSYKDTTPYDPSYYSYYSTDAWYYSQIDDELFLDLAVGRIFGISISDAQSTIVRSLFYEDILKNKENMLVTRGWPRITSAAEVYAIGRIMSLIGYETTVNPKETIPEQWKNQFFVIYLDHGNTNWAGMMSNQIPPLDNSFVFVRACSTCAFEKAIIAKAGNLFCANILRKGGIGYIGATDDSGFINQEGFLNEIFGGGLSIGQAFLNSKNAVLFDSYLIDYPNPIGNPMPWYTLIGDPTLKIETAHHLPEPQLNLVNEKPEQKEYILGVQAIKIDIPDDIKNLCERPEQVVPIRFSTSTLPYATEFITKFKFFNNFEVKALSPGEWQFGKELKKDGEYLWIKSPDNFEEGYFSAATNKEFTNFDFYITFLKNAPDLSVENLKLEGRKVTFEIRNIGNEEVNNTPLDIWSDFYGCFENNCFKREPYYFEGFPNYAVTLSPGGIEEFSFNIPEQFHGKSFNSYLKFFSMTYFYTPEEFIQQNYLNDNVMSILP